MLRGRPRQRRLKLAGRARALAALERAREQDPDDLQLWLMLAQSYFQPTAAGMDPVQAKMMKYGMPLMFSVMMVSLPSGLVLYIMVNTVLTIIQQIFIRRSMA